VVTKMFFQSRIPYFEFAICLVAGGLLTCLPARGQGPPSLNNPNFEIGPFVTDGTVTGWTVVGRVADNTEGATTPTHSAALSSGGNSQGDTLAQSFSTTIGQMYAVDFDAGIFGQRTGGPLQLRVEVLGSGSLVNQLLTPPDAFTFTPSAVTFQHYRVTFTANSATTTLRFSSVGLGNANADQVVDSVVVSLVSQTTPTPTPGGHQGNSTLNLPADLPAASGSARLLLTTRSRSLPRQARRTGSLSLRKQAKSKW
jgi:Protein of unknown function (DUF642)